MSQICFEPLWNQIEALHQVTVAALIRPFVTFNWDTGTARRTLFMFPWRWYYSDAHRWIKTNCHDMLFCFSCRWWRQSSLKCRSPDVIVAQRCLIADSNLPVFLFFFVCGPFFFSANPLLINSSMQPDLTVSRTYTSPMCFQDSIDKELMAERSLLDPLPDLKVKGEEVEMFWKPVSEVVKLFLKRQIITEKSRILLTGDQSLFEPVFSPHTISGKAVIWRKWSWKINRHRKLPVDLVPLS